jgi:DNA transformation protein and related proteins
VAVSPGVSEAVLDLFAFVPEVRVRRMFGGAGVFTGEMMFALILGDELYLKTDEQTRPVFEAEGSQPWRYEREGQATRDMGYWKAPDALWDDPDEARRWADLAIGSATRRFKPKRRATA